jgi:hypothetical protein
MSVWKFLAKAAPVASAGAAGVGQYYLGAAGGVAGTALGGLAARRAAKKAGLSPSKYAKAARIGGLVGGGAVGVFQGIQGYREAGWQGAVAAPVGGKLFGGQALTLLEGWTGGGAGAPGSSHQTTLGPDFFRGLAQGPAAAPQAAPAGFPGLASPFDLSTGPDGNMGGPDGDGGGVALALAAGALILLS